MNSLAKFISRIFEPVIVFTMLLFVAAFRSGMSITQLATFLLTVVIVMIIPVIALRVFLFARHRVDWDIRDRKKRIVPLLVLLPLVGIDVWVVSLWQNPLYTHLFFVFFLWIVGFLCITLRWKVSGHVSVLTLAILVILTWYGWAVFPLLLLIPLLAWSRVVTKNHTVDQTIIGIVYSFGVLAFAQLVKLVSLVK